MFKSRNILTFVHSITKNCKITWILKSDLALVSHNEKQRPLPLELSNPLLKNP